MTPEEPRGVDLRETCFYSRVKQGTQPRPHRSPFGGGYRFEALVDKGLLGKERHVMATREEQETTITFNAADRVVRVWTAYPPHVRKLRADDRAREVAGSPKGQTEDVWGQFEIAASDFSVISFKRRVSDEQRAVMAERARERFGH